MKFLDFLWNVAQVVIGIALCVFLYEVGLYIYHGFKAVGVMQ